MRIPSATRGSGRGFCLAQARVSEVKRPPTHRFLPRTARAAITSLGLVFVPLGVALNLALARCCAPRAGSRWRLASLMRRRALPPHCARLKVDSLREREGRLGSGGREEVL